MTHPHTPHSMRRSGVIAFAVASATCGVCCGSANAQDRNLVAIDVGRCLELASPDERLACFEAQANDALRSERNEPDAPAPAGVPARDSQQPPPAVDAARLPQEDAQTEWVGNITSLRERMPNRYLITLDSGEVWQQQVAERYPLRVGQRVRVYQTQWGNAQRLQADGVKGFIQVRRVPDSR
jgi:hypothetical protein